MLEKMERVLNPQKINDYVSMCLKDKKQIRASELPLNNIEDFVRMIYVRLYGQRKNMNYRIKPGEDIDINGYRFRDYEIHIKE